MSTGKIQIIQDQNQDLVSQVYGLLTQNGNLGKWRINRDRNTITLQWVSHYDPENVDIRVDFHGDTVEITFLQVSQNGEAINSITRVFGDGAVEYVKEMPARGYRITVETPKWVEPDLMAYIIAEIIDSLARVYAGN